MRLLSIDVGMKHLAYCLFSVASRDSYTIEDWSTLNLCGKETQYGCQGKLRNQRPCKKRSRYYKNGVYYCKTHARDRQYHIPTCDMKLAKLKHRRVAYLRAFCKERNYIMKKRSLKKDYLGAILTDLSNNYFSFVENVDSRKVDLITYGRRIKEAFSDKFGNTTIDCVLVENQLGPMALRMKVLQGMIMQHFIERGCPAIYTVSSANKLRSFIENKKLSYHERKKLGIQVTSSILSEETGLEGHRLYFLSHKKKDDLADAFLQGRWYIKERL